MLLLTPQQFAQYDNNAIAVARTAFTLGQLRLRNDYPDTLSKVELPDGIPMFASSTHVQANARTSEAASLLAGNTRVFLAPCREPLAETEAIICSTPKDKRPGLSFSTGLRPSLTRPFKLHVAPSVSLADKRTARELRLHCIE